MHHRSVTICLAILALFVLHAPLLAADEKKNPFPSDWFWGNEQQRAAQDALIGKPAPLLKLSGWINGPVAAKDIKGSIIVVDFWATWCGPCIASIPKNNAIAEQYRKDRVIVLGVCGSGSGQEKMPSVAKEHGIQYPIGRDYSQQSAKAWNVMWWPTYAIVGRDGKVVCVGLQPGAVSLVLDKMLEAEKKAAEAANTEASKDKSAS